MHKWGWSVEGRVAFAHMSLLLFALWLCVMNSPEPLRDGDPPRNPGPAQAATYAAANSAFSILRFPIGYGGYLFPEDSSLQIIPVVLMPLNSLLWGYSIVYVLRESHWGARKTPTHS